MRFHQESDLQGQHSSSQKLEASTPIHLTLDNFESVDLALDRSVVPGRFAGHPHRTQIAAQGSGELRQKRQPRARHRRNPLRQPARASPAQQRTKLQGKFAHSIGAGTEAQKAVKVSLLYRRHAAGWFQQESGDPAGGEMTSSQGRMQTPLLVLEKARSISLRSLRIRRSGNSGARNQRATASAPMPNSSAIASWVCP